MENNSEVEVDKSEYISTRPLNICGSIYIYRTGSKNLTNGTF